MVAWKLVQSWPNLIDCLVIMDCPHFKVYIKALLSSWTQFMFQWYMFVFQLPYLPELLMTARDYKLLERVFLSKTMGLKNKGGFTTEVMKAFKYTFSQPGTFTAAINYHRNGSSSAMKEAYSNASKIEKPILLIWGDDDHALVKEMADDHDMEAINITVKHIPNCSHWVQQYRPDLVNQYMQEFLQNNVS